eukprot:646498-Rhodomonas_salina.3
MGQAGGERPSSARSLCRKRVWVPLAAEEADTSAHLDRNCVMRIAKQRTSQPKPNLEEVQPHREIEHPDDLFGHGFQGQALVQIKHRRAILVEVIGGPSPPQFF